MSPYFCSTLYLSFSVLDFFLEHFFFDTACEGWVVHFNIL